MNESALKSYLERIAIMQSMTVDLETLKKLTQSHPKHITFENIATFTGTVPSIQMEAIFRKLVQEKRGGYCYEQNSLFKEVLQTLGFNIKMHLARVLWNSKDGSETARTHMLLTTDLMGEKYLVDVGFGSMTLTAPILFHGEQETPNGRFRLISMEDNLYRLDVFKNEWLPIYKFSLEEVAVSDLDMANWYVATGPSSIFNKFLMITRVDENARYALFNKELNIRDNEGGKTSREITSQDELQSILANYFNLKLPASTVQNIYTKLDAIQGTFQVTQ